MVEQSAVNRLVVGSNPSWGAILYIQNIQLMNNVSLFLYLKQQNINQFLTNNISHITWISCTTILLGGLLSSISPCMVSALPISIGYINSKKNQVVHGIIFICGILSSITLIGLSTFLLNNSYGLISNIENIINPIFLLIIGLSLLNIVELKLYLPNNIYTTDNTVNHFITTYILGISTGLNVSPCTTPILMTLVAWISSTKQIFTGFIFLIFYSIGYLIPIIVSMLSFNQIKKFNLMYPIWNNVIPLCGSLVVAAGTFSLLHQFLSTINI